MCNRCSSPLLRQCLLRRAVPVVCAAALTCASGWAALPADSTLTRADSVSIMAKSALFAADSALTGGTATTLPSRALQRIDSLLDRRDLRERQRVDTAYRVRATERLRLKVSFTGSGSAIIIRGKSNGADYRTDVEAQNKYTVSFAASYRGLSASLAVNPAHLTGRNQDLNININAYGNRLGADLIYQSATTYEGTVTSGGEHFDVAQGLVNQQSITANAYYVFNSRRFSYPAAFTQSWIQRRSCGSVMAGAQVHASRLTTDSNPVMGNEATEFTMVCGAIGVGYAYNFVTRNRWLIHLSTLPQVVVFNRSRLVTEQSRGKMPYRFPNMMVVGRLAVVRHFDRWFVGLSAVVDNMAHGDNDQLSIYNLWWRGRVFVGLKI